tara:strand:+ start:1061 stop:1237 length:177 start_codon:yes stop_codon:yes gene_type:complete
MSNQEVRQDKIRLAKQKMDIGFFEHGFNGKPIPKKLLNDIVSGGNRTHNNNTQQDKSE